MTGFELRTSGVGSSGATTTAQWKEILARTFMSCLFFQAISVSDKILNLLWQFLKAFGQIFIAVNGQMLTNDQDVRSHCL